MYIKAAISIIFFIFTSFSLLSYAVSTTRVDGAAEWIIFIVIIIIWCYTLRNIIYYREKIIDCKQEKRKQRLIENQQKLFIAFAKLAFGDTKTYQLELVREYVNSKTTSKALQEYIAENPEDYIEEFKQCLKDVPQVGWSKAIKQRNIRW